MNKKILLIITLLFCKIIFAGAIKYVAVGINYSIITSIDGNNWTVQTLPAMTKYKLIESVEPNFNGIVYGNNKWVAAGNNGIVAISSDGIKWQLNQIPSNEAIKLKSIVFSNNLFTILSDRAIYTSSDGITWVKAATNPDFSNVNKLQIINNKLFAVGGGEIMYADPTTSWRQVFGISYPAPAFVSIAYGNNIYVTMAGALDLEGVDSFTSNNGILWDPNPTNISRLTYPSLIIFNKQFIVFDKWVEWFSTDGINWTNKPNSLDGEPSILNFYDVIYDGEKYLAVGSDGTNIIIQSIDGLNWTTNYINNPASPQAIAVKN